MKPIRSTALLLALLALPVAIAACGGGVPGDSVADVAGNPITTQAFDHWMYVAAKGNAAQSPGSPVIVPNDPPSFSACVTQVRKQIPSLAKTKTKQLRSDCHQLFTSLSSQVMDFLIRAYWYQADAAKQGIKITDAQVQKAFQSAKKQQFPTPSAFQSFLKQTGQTMQDILFRVRVNQIYTKLLAKHQQKVTPARIAAYYSSHTSQFGSPESRNLLLIRTSSPAAASAAKAAIQHGQSFAAVAKKYSVDAATKNNGGKLLGVTKGEEERALDAAAFSAPLNKLVGPVHGQFGYYLVEVTSVKAATKQSLAQATPLIRQILTAQEQTGAQTAVDKKARKNWQSQTLCRQYYKMSDCAGYKAPKTTTPTTPTTPTSR